MDSAKNVTSIRNIAALTTSEQVAILDLQKSVLEMVTLGYNKDETLSALCLMAEKILPNAVASVMILDQQSGTLNILSAPSIPNENFHLLNNLRPGPHNGSCGNSVLLNEPVFIMSTLTDPRARDVRDSLNQLNVCACWSVPIRNSIGEAIGSFALSSFESRMPSVFQECLLEVAANIAGITIQQRDQAAIIKANENKLRLSSIALKSASECIYITDDNYDVIEVNSAFENILGISEQEVIGKSARSLISKRHTQHFIDNLLATLLENEQWQGEIWHKNHQGKDIPLWVSISTLKNSEGNLKNYVAVCIDQTELKQNQEQLTYLAYNDSLTGLANRPHFFEKVRHAIELASRSGNELALLFFDVNRFKNINDTFGHSVGDGVLIEIAKRLKNGLRKQDTLGRIGGDEFVALIENISSVDSVYKLAEKIHHELGKTIYFKGLEFLLSGSIGIAIFPKDGESEDILLKHADSAMYEAKKSESGICFYETELTERAERKVFLEKDLKAALQQDQFEILYQPKVCAKTHVVSSLEALLCWKHPQKGLIHPEEFLPIAENTGLINSIGVWFLRSVSKQIKTWLDHGLPPMIVSVNISGRQLVSREINCLIKVLDHKRSPSEYIELELTEKSLFANTEIALRQIKKLRETGVRLAINNFGSGGSSLRDLVSFNVDVLKIDPSLISNIASSAADLNVTKGIVALGHSLNMTVVAESVETSEQAQILTGVGCDELSGFYFYGPMSLKQLSKAKFFKH